MKKHIEKINNSLRSPDTDEKENLQGYPLYPHSEDIYIKYHKGKDLNNDDVSIINESNKKSGAGRRNEKDFSEDMSGNDLDIPGSELDDDSESIGSEDEENNYYSLGGEDHNDLDEDNG
jgi:hypothetical protein